MSGALIEIAVVLVFVGLMVYGGLRAKQHGALSDAYRFAHEVTHDTDRGYYPDIYMGLTPRMCREIQKRFRGVEEKWWVFGVCRERARSERRMASWMAMHMTEFPDA